MAFGYREYAPPRALRPLVACLWEREPDGPSRQLVVPDGCVDLMWLAGRELVFAGVDTGPRVVELPDSRRLSGVRLRPGAAGAVLGVPACELCDRVVSAANVWGECATALQEIVAGAPASRRLMLLAGAVAARGARSDLLVVAAAARLSVPRASVAAVAAELGVSERTLHRRTLAAVGYAPKILARVARLRRLVSGTGDVLAARAYEAGYSSQAHMNDEVRRLTGMTPVRFLEDAILTAA